MSQMARSPKQLGVAIQQQRFKRAMSQSELAKLTGTSQKTISKVENGNPATKIETVFALMAALDMQMTLLSRSKTASKNIGDIF
ncbi:helix-turn-helix domain-containing protein [Parasphingorhabdus cellanae]|uniref:Helix-turn-helix domain-containing protein n=1 Tax=Parasphingorhabdus cellanae TaxID=2806553 RepID=A0ABX7T6S3_9SPHN|nr:helix-turn-helix domain-containing protein [Parasphingorhabdus cellanae]QTD57291.1 helix-turn-helix domain-containing protein [Parasphingorhabdus cellanae]